MKQEKFFSGYNRIMSLVYGAVLSAAILIFSFLYNDNNQAIIQSINLTLFEHRQTFNHIMRIRYDAVKSLQRQARTFINQPLRKVDPDINLIRVSQNRFYLEVQPENFDSYVSIKGRGDLNLFSDLMWQEINMGFRLNSLMGVLKATIRDIDALQYISQKEFQVVYPYEKSQNDNFDPSIYQQEFYQRSLPKNNREDKLLWTDVYPNPEHKSLMITGAAPVYGGSEFRGAVSIDFSMNAINQFFKNARFNLGDLYVINEFRTIIGESTKRFDKQYKYKKISMVLPADLDINEILKMEPLILKPVGHYWVFIAETDFAPWYMIYYCRNSELLFYALRNIIPSFIIALFSITIFLVFVHLLIAREFIKPANTLVKHIIQGSQNSSADIENTKEPWRSWFIAVKDVFERNRDLVTRLESNISYLDEEVATRTKDLSKKNKLLEKAVEDLKIAQDQIITQEKLAGLGALTAGIAHEIRNPLNFILNFTATSKSFCKELQDLFQPLLKKLSQQQQHDANELIQDLIKNMDRIHNHGLRADSIVRGMLAHARGQEEVLKNTNINVLIQENLTLALASYNSRGFLPRIITNYDLTSPPINLFAQDIGRVFLNIFDNACHALLEKYGSHSRLEETPTIEVSTTYDINYVVIIIKDNGLGMPEAVRQKIFNPFFTTKPPGQGTGLGLSMSYEIIVNQHNGKLQVTSELGKSTTFKIFLPLD